MVVQACAGEPYYLSSFNKYWGVADIWHAAINVGADFCSSVGDYVLADSPNPSRLYLDLDDLDRYFESAPPLEQASVN